MKKLIIHIPFWIFVATFFVGAGVLFGFGPVQVNEPVEASAEDLPIFEYGIQTQNYFDQAYLKAGEKTKVESNSAISAHHLLVADKIAALFESVGSNKTKTVVLISPNHFGIGKSTAQTTNGIWNTPYGQLETDEKAVGRILNNSILTNEQLVFTKEHGISALTPFIKRSFPNAKLVPITIHESFSAEDATTLGNAIADQLPNAVVIASIDMSHYMPNYAASYHDEVTLNAIESGGCNNCELEIDANSVLQTLFAINQNRQSQKWTQTHHGSSIQMGIASKAEDNTSHILGYFEKGESQVEPFTAIHFLGDIMLDRDVRKFMDENGFDYPWKNMKRFLMGSHLTVANLEGTVGEGPTMRPHLSPYNFIFNPEAVKEMGKYVDVVSLANNHLDDRGLAGQEETREWLNKLEIPWFAGFESATPRRVMEVNGKQVALIGYHQFRPNIESLETEIKEAKAEGSFVIVYPHWGTEYVNRPGSSQKQLAEIMTTAGADLIIGGHPHVPQALGFEDGTPIVWSLGNFIFDQSMPETWTALTMGVIIKSNKIELHIMPVFTKDGQPKPVSDEEAQEWFDFLADISHPILKDQIKTGTIIFSYGE